MGNGKPTQHYHDLTRKRLGGANNSSIECFDPLLDGSVVAAARLGPCGGCTWKCGVSVETTNYSGDII